MRYVPSTRVGSLVMAAVRHTAKTGDTHPDLAKEVMATTLRCIEQHEQRLSPNAGFVAVDDQMSKLFMDWACALEAGDGHRAVELEEMLDEAAEQHPFDYAQSKREFKKHYDYSSYAEAKKNYIPWYKDGEKNKRDKDFAVVRNRVPGTGKVAIIGDWGTGEPDADALLKAVMGHNPDVILHLGDIYEAGLPLEMEEHFLKPINDTCGNNRPPILTIPGNHEYFSGGKGFFELIDVLNGGKTSDWHQEASFFCLRSDDGKYQFIGADSGLGCIDHPSSPDLEESEIEWHKAQIEGFKGRTIFMTHHQLIAVDHEINGYARRDPNGYGYFNRHFVEAFKERISGTSETYFDRIHLWLWGHAHWFIPFSPNLTIPIPHSSARPTLKRGQLLGGSAREKTYRTPTFFDPAHPDRPYNPHPGVRDIPAGWIVPRSAVDKDARAGEVLVPHATNGDGYGGHLYNHTFAIMDLATGQANYYEVPSWTDATPHPPKDTQLPDALWTHAI